MSVAAVMEISTEKDFRGEGLDHTNGYLTGDFLHLL